MPGGPIFLDAYHVDVSHVGPGVYIGAGANTDREKCTILQASPLGGDKKIVFSRRLPPVLPSGTPKFIAKARAADIVGKVDFVLSYAIVNTLENPASKTLSSEATQTHTWASGQSDVIKELKVTLNTAFVDDKYFYGELVFKSTSTLAVKSGWQFYLIWE